MSTIKCITQSVTAALILGSGAASSNMIDSWNLDNVVTDPPPYIVGETYDSTLFTDTSLTETNGAVIWKEGSVVAPGAQVLTDSPPGSGQNCIITTGTNRADPDNAPKTCTDPFQSAKRVKLEAREPGTGTIFPDPDGEILLENGKPLDMVFEVSAADDLARTYRVFKKYINATRQRMAGFVVELGFGTGADFTASDTTDGLRFTERKQGQNPNPNDFNPLPFYSTPPGDADLGSLMSAGLFGDSADNENRTIDGYFGLPDGGTPWTDPSCDPDPDNTDTERSYYNLVVRTEDRIETVGNVRGLHYCLFGNMLPQGALPLGYFWDEDGDPDTDADTIADWDGSGLSPACNGTPCWHTYVVLDTDPTSDTYGEPVLDAAGNFTRPDPAPEAVPLEMVQYWADHPDTGDGRTTFFFITELDDMGLTNNNYHITVDGIVNWPTYDTGTGTATFTMRTSNVGEGVDFVAPWLETLPDGVEPPAVAVDVAIDYFSVDRKVNVKETSRIKLKISNNGPDPATGQVDVIGTDSRGRTVETFTDTFSNLASGDSDSFTFTWTAPRKATTIDWEAVVTADGDTDLSNNTATATTVVSEKRRKRRGDDD